jgi:maltose O-acetyltransferase
MCSSEEVVMSQDKRSSRDEKAKMLAGQLYNSADPALLALRLRAQGLCHQLNTLAPLETERRAELLAQLLDRPLDASLTICPGFQCDYGLNITLGKGVFFNFNCVVLDVAPVTIGHHCLIGPAVQIYTAMHPLDAAGRRSGLEFARPVSLGDDVWVGGGAIICPGVTVGSGAVIGAGSVVTKDVPAGMVVVGNPARVLKRAEQGETA